jgi:hypothetical protein
MLKSTLQGLEGRYKVVGQNFTKDYSIKKVYEVGVFLGL